MELAKITSKGQVTIPKAVRDSMGLETGGKIVFVESGNGWRIINPDSATKSIKQLREKSDQLKPRLIGELAAEYGLDATEIEREASRRPFSELLLEARDAIRAGAPVTDFDSEEAIVDYIHALRRGEIE